MRSLSLAVGTLIAAGCSGEPAQPTAKPAPAAPRSVRIVRAEPAPWPLVLRATGETRADEDATLAAKVAGRVVAVEVDLGERVKAGDVVARIDRRDFELRVAVAESALFAARTLLGLAADGGEGFDPETLPAVRSARTELEEAQRERRRLVELADAGVATRAELERADARLATAEADLEDARQSAANRRAIVDQREADLAVARQALEDTVIRAPFDGAVGSRLVARGDYLAPGAPIARLVKLDPLRVRIEVPERDAHLVRAGQPSRVEIAGMQAPREARVTRAAPALTERGRTLFVEIDLSNADHALRPGSFAAAEITVDPARAALTIPRDALVSFAGVEKVFVVADGVARERRVEVGRRDDARVEILSGIEPGTELVAAPGNLRTGAPVVKAP